MPANDPTAAATTAAPRLRHLDGAAVAEDPARWAKAYEEVYAEALHLPDHNDPPIAERLLRHAGRPGFALVAAEEPDGRVAGYFYGYTLPGDTLWWEGLTPRPDPEFTREYPGRTVGLCELLVAPAWRRTRVAVTLLESFLASRTEERAAALIAEGNDVVLDRYARFGFRPVGQLAPYPGWRPHTMIVRPLRGA
ncbi:GNAT family N-acetyltransferase [Streptomyces aidingensis]|uniref:Acetyltransferase (GNAT) family protein n=1 Tax=Streptomyces aidingensis TaxID=910347 RepID=A0A1I1JFT1_9ACTN|nr:GNAT family N-acetyltransferase [Streptomyces aidingensis]SFC47459.1 Acetyltransferase (GNAT) family protein [Streptomyces aidingensis]